MFSDVQFPGGDLAMKKLIPYRYFAVRMMIMKLKAARVR
jgi:hypothetical protein